MLSIDGLQKQHQSVLQRAYQRDLPHSVHASWCCAILEGQYIRACEIACKADQDVFLPICGVLFKADLTYIGCLSKLSLMRN